MKKSLTFLLTFLLATTLLAGCMHNEPDTADDGDTTPAEPTVKAGAYSLEDVDGCASTATMCDQKIVRDDGIGKPEVTVIASVHTALSTLKADEELHVYAEPEDADVIIYKAAKANSDDTSGDLYSFNMTNGTIKRMTVNSIARADLWAEELSPNERYLARIANSSATLTKPDGKILYLLDLQNDTSREWVRLTGNESFLGGGNDPSEAVELDWKNDTMIEYSVFDSAKVTPTGDPDDARITKRTATI